MKPVTSTPLRKAVFGASLLTVLICSLLFAAVPTSSAAARLSAHIDKDSVAISWEGTGNLEWSLQPGGPWRSVGFVRTPFIMQPLLPQVFFRLKEQGAPVNFAAPWILDLLAPVDPDPKSFDERLLNFLVITVCETAADGTCNLVTTLTANESTSEGHVISLNNSFYNVHWNAPSSLIGKRVEFRVAVAGLLVGTFKQDVTAEGTLPIKFRVDEHPRIRARVLHEQGFGAAGVAAVLAGEFNLGPVETLLVLSWERYDAADLALALRDIFHLDASAAAQLLKSTGQGISSTATVLRVAYGETPNSAALLLNGAGYPCLEISAALTTSFGLRLPQALAIIRGLGCVPNERCEYPPAPPGSDETVATANLIEFMATALHPLPPVEDQPTDFDQSLLDFLRVAIFEVGDAGQRTLVGQFDSTGSTGTRMDIDLLNHFYQFTWNPDESQVGRSFEVRYFVAGLDLGFFPVRPASNGALPFHFRIDNHPVLRARVLREQGLSAVEIAAQLRSEFALAADAVVKILYEEKFTPVELGQALQVAYSATEVQAATALRLATLPATPTLRMLRETFQQLNRTNNVATLRAAGFGVQDTWRALEIVLRLGNEDIENTVLAGGFTEEEVLEVLSPRLLAKYACLIENSGPILYIPRDEQFFPSSVDWFMERATLLSTEGGSRFMNQVTPANLMETVASRQANQGATKFWFELPAADRGGDLAGTKAYVHAVRLKDIGMTDLQFWIFSPYNGPGTMKARLSIDSYVEICGGEGDLGNAAPLGEHTGDWEAVFLRFDNATSRLVEVYTSQHGDYPRHLTWQSANGHPIFYSSRNGHAFYTEIGDNESKAFNKCPGPFVVEFALINQTDQGHVFRAYEAYDFVGLDRQLLNAPWMGFNGNWGPSFDFNYPSHIQGTQELDRGRKEEILREIAGDCITAIRVVAIPLVAAAACAAPCAVGCAPAALLFGVGYFACLGTCIGICTVPVTIALEIEFDPLLEEYAPAILDAAAEKYYSSSGPNTPVVRTTEWGGYFRFPAENRLFDYEFHGKPTIVTNTRVLVSVSDLLCMKTFACKECACDPTPAPICVNAPAMARVELAIDGTYFDITANIASTNSGSTKYFFDFDTAVYPDGPHKLLARATGVNGQKYEDWFGLNVVVSSNAVILDVDVFPTSIKEGDQVHLRGSFSNPGANQEPVTLDWGDGNTDLILPTQPVAGESWVFEAVHRYLDDAPSGTRRDTYTLQATVGDNLDRVRKELTVDNLPPTAGPIGVSANIVPTGTPMTAMFGFADVGTLDTHTALVEWGDGLSTTQTNVTSPVAAVHAYATPGFYALTTTITDDDRGASSAKFSYVVAYDPGAQGGAGVGQILAPLCDTNNPPQCTTNIASFAFVLNEDRGFFKARFETMGLYFDATNYTALKNSAGRIAISGTGNVNGMSEVMVGTNSVPFKYSILAKDGSPPAPDTFQIRISFLSGTNMVDQVFDSGQDQPIRAGSGAIIIKQEGFALAPDGKALEGRKKANSLPAIKVLDIDN